MMLDKLPSYINKALVFLMFLFLISVESYNPFQAPDDIAIIIPYVKPEQSDTYLCTGRAIDTSEELYIVGFTPVAEMTTVHHMLLYGCVEPGTFNEVWNCGGMGGDGGNAVYNNKVIPNGDVCSGGESRILYAWAKNAPSLVLPNNVAFKIGGDTGIYSLVVQYHYGDVHKMPNSLRTPGVGILLQISPEPRKHLAGVYLLGTGGYIPPKSVTNLETACMMEEDKEIHPFAFRTHSHTLGKVISGYRVRTTPDGQYEWTLIGKKNPQLPQMFYPVEKRISVRRGDILAARCTMESNRSTTTYIGPTRDDEMCNFYVMYYVDDGKLLEQDSCWALGPFQDYWSRSYFGLNNVPAPEDV